MFILLIGAAGYVEMEIQAHSKNIYFMYAIGKEVRVETTSPFSFVIPGNLGEILIMLGDGRRHSIRIYGEVKSLRLIRDDAPKFVRVNGKEVLSVEMKSTSLNVIIGVSDGNTPPKMYVLDRFGYKIAESVNFGNKISIIIFKPPITGKYSIGISYNGVVLFSHFSLSDLG